MAERPAESGGDLAVRLEVEREYVVGLPMPATLTLEVLQKGTVLSFLPEPTPFSPAGCVGLTLRSSDGLRIVSDQQPSGAFDLSDNPPPLQLGWGDRRRYLIDLSLLVPPGLAAGSYQATLSYVASKRVQRAGPARLQLRRPTEREAAWIAAQAAELAKAGDWGSWVAESPENPAALSSGADAPPLARFHAALRFLAHAPAPTRELPTDALQAVDGLPAPEARAVLLELLRARGDGAGARSLAARIRSETPTLAWLVEASERGAGRLAAHRFAP